MVKRVSMRTIASAAGVSAAAVSQILNDRGGFVSAETRARVRKLARELGYRPNYGYKLMHAMETRTVGIMVANSEQMLEFHIRELVLMLLNKFSVRNSAAFCHVLEPDDEAAAAKVREFLGRGAERFVFLGLPRGYEAIFAMLDEAGAPYVSTRELAPRHVTMDTYSGMLGLLTDLKARTAGHFRLLMPEYHRSNPRVRALDQVLNPHDESELLRRIVPVAHPCAPYYHEACRIGYESLAALLEREPDLRGAAFSNDALAIGGAKLMLERNRRDFVLTGFNGDPALTLYPYPVSTAVFDLEKTAELLAERVFDSDPCAILVPTKIQLVK